MTTLDGTEYYFEFINSCGYYIDAKSDDWSVFLDLNQFATIYNHQHSVEVGKEAKDNGLIKGRADNLNNPNEHNLRHNKDEFSHGQTKNTA
eukprot:3785536-Ditylum_brightwellii.AAC.2